uniref:UBP-type domain-containing protein n=1 Tax=Meloidogyne incognita TaxID=6306 RepID=A0A914L3Z4_MELIC
MTTEQLIKIASDSEQEEKPQEFFAVTPLKTCPHLGQIADSKLPSDGLNTKAACNKCSNTGENWVCLKCFEVYCSRYVEGHALAHTEETKHPLALSFADFSVWCYPCNSYIDNKVFDEAKEAAIKSKFGGKTEG